MYCDGISFKLNEHLLSMYSLHWYIKQLLLLINLLNVNENLVKFNEIRV